MASTANSPGPFKDLVCPHCESQLLDLVEVLAPDDAEKATREAAKRSLGGAGVGAAIGAIAGPGGAYVGSVLGAALGGSTTPNYYGRYQCRGCGGEHERGLDEGDIPEHRKPG